MVSEGIRRFAQEENILTVIKNEMTSILVNSQNRNRFGPEMGDEARGYGIRLFFVVLSWGESIDSLLIPIEYYRLQSSSQ